MLELGTVASTEPRLAGCECPPTVLLARIGESEEAARRSAKAAYRLAFQCPLDPAASGRVYHRRGRERLKKFEHL
jgi:hypothetical protein